MTTEPTPLNVIALMKVVMDADNETRGFALRGTTNWAAHIGKAVQDAVLAARAPADSMLEDAADPLQGAANWLAEAHGQFSPVVLSRCLMIGYNRAKRLHDAALAARKQGGTR